MINCFTIILSVYGSFVFRFSYELIGKGQKKVIVCIYVLLLRYDYCLGGGSVVYKIIFTSSIVFTTVFSTA